MFTQEEIKQTASIDVSALVVMLQLISRVQNECRRFNGAPAIADSEMGVIGVARDSLIRSVEVATGKNFDVVREEQNLRLAAEEEARRRAQEAGQVAQPGVSAAVAEEDSSEDLKDRVRKARKGGK